MKRRTSLVLPLIAVFALLLVSCGKSDDSSSGADLPTYEVKAAAGLTGSAKALADAGKVTVGVKGDQPNLGFKDATTNSYSGFDIEIAKMIAADLGIAADKMTFKEIPSKNRETALANGEVDYYVGTYTINDDRKKLVSFAGPYFLAHQDLLVRDDDDSIKSADDLTGKNVCSATGSTPIERIKSDYPKAKTTEFDVYSKCVTALLNKQVDAVTTDDAILAGYAAQYKGKLKVVGTTFSDEPYGVGVKLGDKALQDAIASSLKRHEGNGDYEKAYDATLGGSGKAMPAIPKITEGSAS